MDGQILVVNDQAAFELSRGEKVLVVWIAIATEVLEIFRVFAHLLLLFRIFGCQNSLMSLPEKPLMRVNHVKYSLDVALESVGIHVKCAERFQVLEHFLDALTDNKGHLGASGVVQAEQVGVSRRPGHHVGEATVERIDQSVINVEYHV